MYIFSEIFRCVANIIEVICRNPELALFFDMYNFLMEQNGLKSRQNTYDFDQSIEDTLDQCSIGIQTDVHPIPFAKDKNYKWNVWDLRREAIKLANLQKCQTKSTQTNFGT